MADFVQHLRIGNVQPDMRRYIRTHKWIAAVCILGAFVACCWLWSLTAALRGRLAAVMDIRSGQYQLLGYGLPRPSRPEYARCLRERYNIKFRAGAGCIVSESLVSYVDAYDSAMVESVNRRVGHDVFKECSEEAERTWTEHVKARRAPSPTVASVIQVMPLKERFERNRDVSPTAWKGGRRLS